MFFFVQGSFIQMQTQYKFPAGVNLVCLWTGKETVISKRESVFYVFLKLIAYWSGKLLSITRTCLYSGRDMFARAGEEFIIL